MCIPRTKFHRFLLGLVLFAGLPLLAQKNIAGTPQIKLALERLNVLGSVLMIAAHPDDENTELLAYFARGEKLRTAYLSLTRGEGGQNLIGSEQGDLLGVIRTQELLAARRIDGAEQYFTRAIDFGFSKNAGEALAKWGYEQVLGDVVWVIRRFQPDAIVLRFSGTPADGHGHHQASAILAKEAFSAAADRSRFREQLQWVKPWQAKRLMWNVFAFTPEQRRAARALQDRIEIDTGAYNPVLGFSYAQIAGMSRSQHRSQGMGAPEPRGSISNVLTPVAGEPAGNSLFDGVDLSWKRVLGGAATETAIMRSIESFKPESPSTTIPRLIEARKLMLPQSSNPLVKQKLAELDEAIALCAGLWLDASVDRHALIPGSRVPVNATALNRSNAKLRLVGMQVEGVASGAVGPGPRPLAYNQPLTHSFDIALAETQPYTEPYWLKNPKSGALYGMPPRELLGQAVGPAEFQVRFDLEVEGQRFSLRRPVIYRYVDPVLGELTRPVAVVPRMAIELSDTARIFGSPGSKQVEVQARAMNPKSIGEIRLDVPEGWKTKPAAQSITLMAEGEQARATFSITPPSVRSRGLIRVSLTTGTEAVADQMISVHYPHIPPQTVFSRASLAVVRAPIETLAKSIGYVMGAGDEVPEALRQLGCDVTLLNSATLSGGDLDRFDAIVTGVRAYNVRSDLRANQHRLLDYVRKGGTMVVQYNVLDESLPSIGPFPIQIGRDRVSVEEAPVRMLDAAHPVWQLPNRIETEDFEGWVQERGLYFASKWDRRYTPLLASADPGEEPHAGGMLYARDGKGVHIFTAYSWFRQLPAGVPGAYRIFANLISAGRAAREKK